MQNTWWFLYLQPTYEQPYGAKPPHTVHVSGNRTNTTKLIPEAAGEAFSVSEKLLHPHQHFTIPDL